MSRALELRILGPLELREAGTPTPVGGLKPRQLLATLALQHGRTVSVDQLVEVLWPRQPPRSAVANVHTYVSRLRLRLGADRLRRQPPGYRLDLDPDELDATRFCAYARAGDVDAALALWRGDPVEDLPPSPAWHTGVQLLVERHRSVRLARCRMLIEADDPRGALADLRTLVADDPLHEEAWLLLVTAQAAIGDRAEALASYAVARRTLAQELGVEPAEPLRELHRRLLRQPASVTAAPRLGAAEATVLRALGLLAPEPAPAWIAAAALDRPADAPVPDRSAADLPVPDPSVPDPSVPDLPVSDWLVTGTRDQSVLDSPVARVADRSAADPVLEALHRARLIRRVGVDAAGQDRYRLPTLIQLLATDLPGEPERDLSVRVLGGYLSLADQAGAALGGQLFGPGRRVAPRWPVPAAGALVRDAPAWFAAERGALLAAIDLAARIGQTTFAWEIAHALVPWCDRGGHWDDWDRSHRRALAACRQAGDLLGEAVTLRGLGQLHLYRDRYDAAEAAFSRARLAYARLGLARGEAGALAGLGAVQRIRGELDAALSSCLEALAGYRAAGDLAGEAYAHGGLGMVRLARRELAEAGRSLTAGLRIARQVGDGHREAHLIHQLGLVRLRAGERASAHRLLGVALARFVAIGDAHGEAYCRHDLAGLEGGDRAIRQLTGALELFERVGDHSAQARTARRLGELHLAAGRTSLGRAYLAEAGRLSSSVRPGPDPHPARPGWDPAVPDPEAAAEAVAPDGVPGWDRSSELPGQ